MIVKRFDDFTLLLSHNPCEIFKYFGVTELHGLTLSGCEAYPNSDRDAYIAGWCNLIPDTDRYYCYINLSRCNDLVSCTGLVMHEMIHMTSRKHNDQWATLEEEMVTWAEKMTYEIVNYIISIKFVK